MNDKVYFVTGVIEGAHSYWRTIANNMISENAYTSRDTIIITTTYRCLTFYQDVSVNTLIDGIDTFYHDYKNRLIDINATVDLVVEGIAGRSILAPVSSEQFLSLNS